MSEYSNNNSIENEYYYDDDEITLGELFGHIFDRFKLIVIITLIFSVIGVVYALLQPRQYSVTAVVSIREPSGTSVIREYGGRYFTAAQQLYEIFSQENIENAIAETPTENPDAEIIYEDIVEDLEYSNISGTYNYKIYVEKTADTDYWTAFITNLVYAKLDKVSETYLSEAQTVKKTIEDSIADNEALLPSTTSDVDRKSILDKITELREKVRLVEVYIDALDSSFQWVAEPVVGTKNQAISKALVCIIFFLCGGVIGVITALALGFSDKHIYSSKALKKIVDGKLIASIPLYKDSKDIDKREFEYITSKLNLSDDKTLSLISLNPKAGNLTIEKGLRTVTKADITNLGIVHDNPEALTKLSDKDYALVILRAGLDDSIHIEKLMEDLKTVGIDNYGFVFNCVDVSDRNVTVYLNKNKYRHHKWLRESWKGYYRKNY